jgi:hypothetical protein
MPKAVRRLDVAGRVRWCNRLRGYVSFAADRTDASPILMRVVAQSMQGFEAIARMNLRPDGPVTVAFAWHPELDIFAPWRPEQLRCEDGTQLTVRPAIEPGTPS